VAPVEPLDPVELLGVELVEELGDELDDDESEEDDGAGGNAIIALYQRSPSESTFLRVLTLMPTSTCTHTGGPVCVRSQLSSQKSPS